MENRIDYDLIARYLAGECTREEAAAIETHMDDDPVLNGVVRELHNIWNAREERPAAWDVERVWKRISHELDQSDEGTGKQDRAIVLPASSEKKKNRKKSYSWLV